MPSAGVTAPYVRPTWPWLQGRVQCARLVACPGLNVVFPNSVGYNITQAAYISSQEAALMPSCIVKPSTSDNVSEMVRKVVEEDCKFAIKGQGHFPSPGFANVEDVYLVLDPLRVTVAGGRVGSVGVGGLTLGGGISYVSPQAGFTCDTVKSFELVLASGRIVEANENSHQDLYGALKGGIHNFRVVIRFDFQTLPISMQILAGSLVNGLQHRQAVFRGFEGIAKSRRYNEHASFATLLSLNTSTQEWTLLSDVVHTTGESEPLVYKELMAVPSISNTLHLTSLSSYVNESSWPTKYQSIYTATHGVSASLMEHIFQIARFRLRDEEPGVTWTLGYEPLPGVLRSYGEGKNVLGTSGRGVNTAIFFIQAPRQNAKSSSHVGRKSKALMAEVNEIARKRGLLMRYVYGNYADASQDPVASYGKENERFLRRVAREYDPDGDFQMLVPGGFKLGERR